MCDCPAQKLGCGESGVGEVWAERDGGHSVEVRKLACGSRSGAGGRGSYVKVNQRDNYYDQDQMELSQMAGIRVRGRSTRSRKADDEQGDDHWDDVHSPLPPLPDFFHSPRKATPPACESMM